MNLDQLALLGEAIGGFAVVLTLLYLAYETRRNNAILVASATSDAYLKWTEINDLISSDEQLAGLWVRLYNNCSLESFDPNERLRITVSVRSVVQRIAAVHSLYHNGLVDKAYWQTITTWLAGFLKVRGISQWWELEKQSSLFSEEFIREIDALAGFSIGPGGQRQNGQDQVSKTMESRT